MCLPKKSDSRRHEVLGLVLGPEKPFVEFGQKALDAHDQEEDLNQAQVLEIVAEVGYEEERQKNGDVEVDATRKGFGLEAFVRRVFERAPQRGVQARYNGDCQWHEKMHLFLSHGRA